MFAYMSNRRSQMRSGLCVRALVVILLTILVLGLPVQARADAIWLLFRDTIAGGVVGLIVGGAIGLAAEEWEPVRVGIIAGTFTGLGLGVYQAIRESSREEQSILNIEPGEPVSVRLAIPDLAFHGVDAPVGRSGDVAFRVNVIGVRF
jgi:hypothetical protein